MGAGKMARNKVVKRSDKKTSLREEGVAEGDNK